VHVLQTTYHLKNKADIAQIAYLEHPRPGGEWKLFDTAEPHEVTENYWRFRFAIEPKKVTAFVVRQRQVLEQYYTLADLSDRQFSLWMSEKYLDRQTGDALKKVLEARQEAARFEAAMQALEKERAGIHAEQKRIRENLQALGDRPGEKELRERFVRTLNAQEDRLAQIDTASREQERSRDECRKRISELLAKLEYDAEV
jgi:Glu-tRNA(Gln) amidotransferase subunit E-like FAD-binding protein